MSYAFSSLRWRPDRGTRRHAAVLVSLVLAMLGTPATASAGAGARAGDTASQQFGAPAADDAAARRAVATLPRATAVNDRDGNKVFDDLDARFALATGARQKVIVSFVADMNSTDGAAAMRRAAPTARIVRTFDVIPALSGSLTVEEAVRVAALPGVRQIELDSPGVKELETATTVMGADAVVDEMGISGSLDGDMDAIGAEDVTIAVLDTGFDEAHADLDGKLEAFVDIADGAEDPYDTDGHGTHVASIAAGWGRGQAAQRGVAPGAGIVGLRIETESHALAGYQWIVENRDRYDIRVSTISFGFGVATDGTTALERAVDATWAAGVVCFKSNGNSGPNKKTMTVPAAARGILAVGSLLDPGGAPVNTPAGGVQYSMKYGFALSEFSSRGPTSDGRVKPDLLAPGESIMAAARGTGNGYVRKSGTSMAAPFAAGTAALILAANPALTPDEVREVMFATAEEWGVDGPDNDYGHGRIQVWHAVQRALALAGVTPRPSNPPTVPVHLRYQYGATVTPLAGIFASPGQHRFPVAITAIGDSILPSIRVSDSSGFVLGVVANADRQHHFTYQPAETAAPVIEVVYGVNETATVDISYGVAKPNRSFMQPVRPGR